MAVRDDCAGAMVATDTTSSEAARPHLKHPGMP
jgi:hypothetical protein